MKRIYGLETEYGLAYTQGESRYVGPEEIARYVFRPVVDWGRSSNVFLPNGSRLYLDVGSHPEYASAECDSLTDLVAQDRAGQAIMADLMDQAGEAMRADGLDGQAHMVKNNQDAAGNSYGSHENFLIRRKVEFTHLTGVLLPFLVVRQLLVGAGAVIPAAVSTELKPADLPGTSATRPREVAAGSSVFGLSARSDVMWEGVSSATTRSRPIINARDEPHADAEKYRRLHVIVGDSSMSQTTTELKVGAAGLVLDLIESGYRFPDLTLARPITDIRHVARDLTGMHVLELKNGSSLRTLDMLETYYEAAAGLVERGDHSLGSDEVAARVLDRWKRMISAVYTQDFSSVDTEIDWVIKKKLFDRYLDRSGVDLSDPRIARLDVAYHDVTSGQGLFAKLESQGLAATVVDEAAIASAQEVPPATTRAALRGRFVAAAHDARRDYTVDWVYLRLNDRQQSNIALKDPFASTDAHVEELIAGLDAGHAPFSV